MLASLLYESGVRLMEYLRLRVKDLDFDRYQITVRHGKGGKDRRTMLPVTLIKALQIQAPRQTYCAVWLRRCFSFIPRLFT